MTLRLKGSTSGHTEVKAPAAAGSNTLTLPTGNGSAEQFLKNSGTAGELEFSSMVETSTGVGIGTAAPDGNIHIADGTRANLILKKTGLNDVANSSLHGTYDVMQIGAGGSFASYNVETATADTQIGHNFYRHSGGTTKYKYTDAAARIRFNSTQGAVIFDRAASGNAGADITFSESMRIDSSGNVGIGVSSPSDTGNFGRALDISGSNGSAFYFRNNGSASNTGTLAYLGTDLYLQNRATSSGTMRFCVGGTTERMRIDSSGNVGIGTSSPFSDARLTVDNGGSGDASIALSRSAAGNNDVAIVNSGGQFIVKNGFASTVAGLAERMKVDASGYLYVPNMPVGGSANIHWSSGNGQFFVSSSSKRFKHSISDYDKGLAELKQLQPKYFTYNDEPAQKQRAGFIAEDFHSLGLTEYVEYWNDDDGNATVPSEINYPNMVAILVKSLQEATTRIETLETEVAALKAG